MLETLGGLLGGLGLFFVGMWLLTENLKGLTNRRLRMIVADWVPNRYAAWGWGALSGSILQSLSALTFITISMFRANLLTTERAFAFLIGGNLGAGILVLLVSLDIQLAALYVLGAASVLMLSERAIRFRNIGASLFGAALMFVGLGLVKGSAASFTGQPVFDEFLGMAGGSLWFAFLAAVALSFIVQSSVAVMVFAVGMASVGILTDDQAIMSIFGSYLGTNATLLMLSANLTGVSRRIAMVQVFYNFLTIAVFIPLLYVEIWTGIPLIKSLILSLPLDQPLAALSLVTDVFVAAPVVFFVPRIAQLFSLWWPATSTEVMSRVAYIHARNYGDVTAALDLISLEHRRVLSSFSSYLDAVRHGRRIDTLKDSIRQLIREIDEFFTEARKRHPAHEMEAVNSMLAQQRLMVWLEEQFSELCSELNELPNEGEIGQFRNVIVDGIDAVILVIIDGLTSRDPDDWRTAIQLTGDRSQLLSRIGADYMSGDSSIGDAAQASILKVTNTTVEIFFLFSRLTREIENSRLLLPAQPASPRPLR